MAQNKKLSVLLDLDKNKFNSGINSVQSTLQKLGITAKEISAGLIPTVAAGLGVYELKELAFATSKASIQMDGLENKFKAAAGSAYAGAKSLEFARNEAEKLGLEFFKTADAYAGFEAAALRSGLSLEQTQQIFDDVSNAVVSLHLSGEKAELVFKALEQISSKGIVSSEELRQQLGDHLPGAFEIAAMSMGKTTAEFNKLLKDGKILSDDFLPKFASKIKEQLGESAKDASQQASAEFNRLRTSVFNLSDTLGDGLNPILSENARLLSGQVNWLNDSIKKMMEYDKEAGNITNTLKDVTAYTGILAGSVAASVGVRQAVSGISSAMASTSVIIAGTGTNMARTSAFTIALGTALKGNLSLALLQARSGFIALGQAALATTVQFWPYIAIAAVVGGVSVAIYNMAKNSETAAHQMKRLNKVMEESAEKSRTEADEVHGLIEKIDDLGKSSNKNSAINYEFKKSKEALIAKFPTLRKEIEESIKKYGKLTEAVKEAMKAEIALTKIRPLQEAFTKAQIDVYKAQARIDEPLRLKFNDSLNPFKWGIQSKDDYLKELKVKEDQVRKALIDGAKRIKKEVGIGVDFGDTSNIGSSGSNASAEDGKSAGVYNIPKGKFELEKFRKDLADKNQAVVDSLQEELNKIETHSAAKNAIIASYDEGSQSFDERVSLLENHLNKERELRVNSAKETKDTIKDLEEKLQEDILSLEGSKQKNRAAAIAALTTKAANEKAQIEINAEKALHAQMKKENEVYGEQQLELTKKIQLEIDKIEYEHSKERTLKNIEEWRKVHDTSISAEEEILRQRATLGQISREEELRGEMDLIIRKKELAKQEFDNKIKALNESLSATDGVILSDEEKRRINDEINDLIQAKKELSDSSNLEAWKKSNEIFLEQTKYARSFKDDLASGWSSEINQLINGTLTFQDAFISTTNVIRNAFANVVSGMLEDWLRGNLSMNAITSLFGLTKTTTNAAVTASNATVAASNAAVATSNTAVATSAVSSSIAANTAGAAMSGFSAMVSPVISSISNLATEMGKLALSSAVVAISFPIIAASSAIMALSSAVAALGMGVLSAEMAIMAPIAAAFVPVSLLMAAEFATIGATAKIAATAMSQLAIAMSAASVAWIPVVGAALAPAAAMATGAAITTASMGVQFRENGGPVEAGQAYIVGETRAELFIPRTSGTIIPDANAAINGNSKTSQPIYISMPIQAIDAKSFESRIDGLTDRIIKNLSKKSRRFQLAY